MKGCLTLFATIGCVFVFQFCLFTSTLPNRVVADVSKVSVAKQPENDTKKNIDDARAQIEDIRKLVRGMKDQPTPQPRNLQWNRYVTDNFEILSVDDAQGKYLSENIEFIKIWCIWRWGMKDFNFPTVQSKSKESVKVKVKLICVPSTDLYEKLFNKNTSVWRVNFNKDGVPEYAVWYIADGNRWNTKLPVLLTEVVLANFEAHTGSKIPAWCHRGMSVLNGRIEDIRAKLSQAGGFDSKSLLTTTHEAYDKMNEQQKISFDAHAAFFCLWLRQEFNGKVFLDYLGGSMINPEYCLQYFNIKTYAECDTVVRAYITRLSTAADYSFTW